MFFGIVALTTTADDARGRARLTEAHGVVVTRGSPSLPLRSVPQQRGFHCIMAELIQFFGMNHQTFSEKQLRRFGQWVNAAVLIEGPLENAISTCFLEHTRQVKINRVIAPYLSREAKDKSHA